MGEIWRRSWSGSSTLDCWLSPLFGERKSISDQAPIRLDIGLLLFSLFNCISHRIFLFDIKVVVSCVIPAVDVRIMWPLHNSGLHLFVFQTTKQSRDERNEKPISIQSYNYVCFYIYLILKSPLITWWTYKNISWSISVWIDQETERYQQKTTNITLVVWDFDSVWLIYFPFGSKTFKTNMISVSCVSFSF